MIVLHKVKRKDTADNVVAEGEHRANQLERFRIQL